MPYLLAADADGHPTRVKLIDDATGSPTVDDDAASLGVTVGSLWLDTAGHRAWLCEDASTGSAVWTELTGGGTSWSVGPSPPTAERVGDLWLDSDDGSVYRWNGALWDLTADLTGPAGTDGATWFDGAGTPTAGLGNDDDYYLEVI